MYSVSDVTLHPRRDQWPHFPTVSLQSLRTLQMTPSQSKIKTSISFSNCEFGSVNLSTLARRTVLVWKLLLLVGVQNAGGETLDG
jgi:hypothetical protein